MRIRFIKLTGSRAASATLPCQQTATNLAKAGCHRGRVRWLVWRAAENGEGMEGCLSPALATGATGGAGGRAIGRR